MFRKLTVAFAVILLGVTAAAAAIASSYYGKAIAAAQSCPESSRSGRP